MRTVTVTLTLPVDPTISDADLTAAVAARLDEVFIHGESVSPTFVRATSRGWVHEEP